MVAIPIGIVTGEGLIMAPYTATSLADAATKEPQGVYTTGRTYHRDSALLLDQHLDRLEQSAHLEKIFVTLDREAVRKALRTLIEYSSYEESRFRITIPRRPLNQVIITLEPFQPVPPDILKSGSRTVTIPMARENPVAKSTEWMITRKSAVEKFPAGVYEGILVSPNGTLLEGTSSNFYAILDGQLRTANEGILEGIARRVLLTVASSILPESLEPIHLNDLPRLSEALLTSSGRGVVPIVQIDDQHIGSGKPGPLSHQLQHAYDAWAMAHLEKI